VNVGIDIVEIQRIRRLIDRYSSRFLNKVFTSAEQRYCDTAGNRYASYAGRFAAKEAIRKALQPMTDCEYLPFLHMEILSDNTGMPVPSLQTNLDIGKRDHAISISISHEKTHAVACAIVEEK